MRFFNPRVQAPTVARSFCTDWCIARFPNNTKAALDCIYNCNKIRDILSGGQAPGTTKKQRRAIRKAFRGHPSCPPESPFRCRNGQCVDHWSQCPDKPLR